MGKILILATYAVYAAFWIRFILHGLVWWRAMRRMPTGPSSIPVSRLKAYAFAAGDVILFMRLFMVNPALWFGEWLFHACFLLVLLRHLKYFLDPVPGWVWSVQTAGLIGGYILPFSLIYILVVRLLTKREKYASPVNVFLLSLVLVISVIGVLMHALFKPNLVDVKLFAVGIAALKPAVPPDSVLFLIHFFLVLVLILYLPTHIFTAPLVMMEARRREQELRVVMHEKRSSRNMVQDCGGPE